MRFRRILSIFLAMAILASLVPSGILPAKAATSGTIENCKWSLNGTVLTITGSGPLYYRSSTSPWGTDITKLIVKSGVTYLDGWLFQNCTKLTTVTLPDDLSSIGTKCFAGCTSLSSINIPSELAVINGSAFSGCSALTSITLPEGLTTIRESAFQDCSLTSIALPDSLVTLGDKAFFGNTMHTISFGKEISYIHPNQFGTSWQNLTVSPENTTHYSEGNCIVRRKDMVLVMGGNATAIPAGVKTIGDYAFIGAKARLSIPDTVTAVEKYAFANCDSLREITVPDSVVKLVSSAFMGCDKLASVTLGSQITRIPYALFEDCTALKQVTFRGEVTEIGQYAFSGCTSLEEFAIPDTVTTLGDYAFSGCTALKNITLSKGLSTVPTAAFSNCSALEQLQIPASVTSIGTSTFAACSSLTDISFPQGLTTIGGGAFASCTALEEISLPDTVVELYDTTFEGTAFHNNTDNWEGSALYLGDILLDYKESLTEAADYAVKEGTRVIAGNALSSTYYLINLTLPDSLTHIGPRGCAYGYRLANVTFGHGLISIGENAFYNCSKLTDVTLGDSLTAIGIKAFYNCDCIRNVRLGRGLTQIGTDAFTSTDKLERVDISDDNPCFYSSNGILYDAATGKAVITPASRALLLTINYLDSRGNPIANPVEARRYVSSSKSYSYSSPDIAYHTPTKTVVSGNLTQDLTVNVIYYEQTITASGTCGSSINWTLYDDGTLVLRGTGAMPAGVAPWKSHSHAVTALVLDSRITSVSAGAFEDLPNLAQVDFGFGITAIGDNAFHSCGALTALTLPDSLTSIGSGSFAETALTRLTIPEGVTSLGSGCFQNSALEQVTLGVSLQSVDANAFAGCDNLTQVIFRGKPAVLGIDALGSTDGKLVLYYPNNGWENSVTEGLWNGYTAIPREIAQKDTTASDILIIKVVDRQGNPLPDALVTLAGQTQSANQQGVAYFLKPDSPVELRISCSNHLTFVNPAYLPGGFRVEYIQLSDQPSAVWGIACDGSSMATSVVTLNCNSDATVTLTVGGYSKYEITSYELWQGNRLLASQYTDRSQCTFALSADSFRDSQTVFVRMYNANGDCVAAPLNLRTLYIAEVSNLQLVDELSRLKLHFDLENLGAYDLPLTFQSGEQALYTQVSGSTIRIGMNVDVNALFESAKDEVTAKTKIQKAVQDYLRSSVQADAGFQCDFAGYLEIECLGGGEYAVRTCYVKVAVSAGISFNAQASFYGIVGVYFKASLSGTGSLDLLVTGFAPESGLTVEDANFTLENVLEVEGGAFLLWGAGSAGLYGKLSMGFQLGLVPDVEFESVYISGELGVKWSVFWGLFSGSKEILAGDLYRWPETLHLAMKALSGSNLQLSSRDYLENRSPWQGGEEALRVNTSPNVNAQVVTCNGITVMAFLDDNQARDNNNYQTLYYSILDPYTGLWSEPVQVDDNDTFDCEFHLYTDGQEIYLLYTEQKASLSGLEAMDPKDPQVVAALVQGVEVSFTQFREGGFEIPVRLTDNDVCETLPTLYGGDTLQAVWCAAATMDTAAQSGSGTLYASRLDNGLWSAPAALTHPQRTVSQVCVFGDCILYTADGDGDSTTTDDIRLILLSPDGTARQLAQGEITALSAADNRLVYIHSGILWMLDSPQGEPVCLNVTATGTCQILSLSQTEWLICFTAPSQTGTELYALGLDANGTATAPVALTETQGNINRFSVALAEGQLVAVFTEAWDTTSLCRLQTAIAPQLTLEDVYFDTTAITPNQPLDLELTLTNTGLASLNEVTVRLLSGNGEELFTVLCPLTLDSGATGTLRVSPTLPGEISTYQLELTWEGGTLCVPLSLCFCDINLNAQQTLISGQSHLRLEAVNLGNLPTGGEITVSTAEGRELYRLAIDSLEEGEAETYLLDVSTLPGGTVLICQAVAGETDAISVNDRCVLTLFEANTQGFPVDPEVTPLNPELSAYSATYDRSLRTPISLLINRGWQGFTGITGLTKSQYALAGKTLTLNSSYLYNLPEGVHTLELTFSDGSTRAFTLTVMDSAPVYLYGAIQIVGTAAPGHTLYADCSAVVPNNAKLSYKWEVGGEIVSTTDSYIPRPQDQGQGVFLTVTGIDSYTGTFYDSKSIAAATQERPLPPVVMQVGTDSVTLVTVSGLEYSLDGVQWQLSGTFTGLTPNTPYVFVARDQSGAVSQYVYVTTAKSAADTPSAPVVSEITDSAVTLQELPGGLYSMDGITWQSSNRFTDLLPNTGYVFYQKTAETDTHYESPVSEGVAVTTLKATPAVPPAPEVQTRSATTVSLKFVEGYEYSLDGITWQSMDSGLWHSPASFTDLMPNTTYTFYQRIGETETSYASASSEALVIRTWKKSPGNAPDPVMESVTTHTVTVAFTQGMEYKIEVYNGFFTKEEIYTGIWGTAEEPIPDNTGWQSSNVFEGLQPDTQYIVYQRYAATEDCYAGASGDGVLVRTLPLTPISGQLEITGDPRVGQTLSWELTDLVGELSQLEYGWYAQGELISTDAVLTLTPTLAGQVIRLQVTGTGSWTGTLEAVLDTAVYLPGDVNGDNKVNMRDWSMLYNHICETSQLPQEACLGADVTGDGKINMKDWLRLYNHISETAPLW